MGMGTSPEDVIRHRDGDSALAADHGRKFPSIQGL
jgi:hypothetical protein